MAARYIVSKCLLCPSPQHCQEHPTPVSAPLQLPVPQGKSGHEARPLVGVSHIQVTCLVLEEYGEAGFMVRALGLGLEKLDSALRFSM